MAERPPADGARVNQMPSHLDDVALSRPRLSILAALIAGNAVDFTFLQKNLGISDGNLSTHLSKLEAGRYSHAHAGQAAGEPERRNIACKLFAFIRGTGGLD
jgi:DNA-binding transcriptional ArsR family regulator